MTPPHTVIVANPASGGGKGRKVIPKVRAAMEMNPGGGDSFEIRETAAPGHATELAAAAVREGARRVVALGGDGTIHEVVNGIVGAEGTPVFGVVPVGTGNDFFRMVGPKPRLDAALEILRNGAIRSFDVGVARWKGETRYFVNLIGFGIDVEVLRRRESFQRLSGLPQYLAALLRALVAYKPVPLAIEFDGATMTMRDRALICTLTVGPTIGGGFRLAPDAVPDDGALDFCLIRPLGLLEVLTYIPKVIAGRHGGLPKVELRQVAAADVASDSGGEFYFELDGELVDGTAERVDVSLLRSRLQVLVSKEETVG